ncbi:hypothetical protein OIE75_41215 (plasmid) [Streptomyces sp. NBC_01723]|uniref:hypothetical protein n=1 Tax=Streptomyces sp. NBC_01723 TaxID=2975921 RepID=UPI002E35E294|nr:hypothetical protein [Streptomyces sp. NBC_01723]
MTAQGEGRIREPYDPLPDLIERAEHRTNGIAQLKEVAHLALSWHAPSLTWVTGGLNSKDPETGEPLWSAATICSCGVGEFPCPQRRWLTAIFGIEEGER